MSDAVVNYWRGTETTAKVLDVRINGASPTYRLRSDRIAASLLCEIDEVLLDLLDIAALVHCADSSVSRGGDVRSGFGESWHRKFNFQLAARRPDIWSAASMKSAIEDCVSFLTDDTVSFQFEQGFDRPVLQTYLDFGEEIDDFAVDDVILFSGGLDSFAGALQTLCDTDKRVALVTHRSAPKTIPFQDNLGSYLKKRFPGRVLHIVVEGQRVGTPAAETTLRSRSFLFAALGHVVGQCLGAKRVCLYENGVVSHNLPISPQVIGTMATRTTHPLAVEKFRAILSFLSPIPVATPFEWLTKVDILQIIERCGALELIKASNSCAYVREQNALQTHCGNCSQCVDRRFAILAAGLSKYEPEEMYGTDVLFGARSQNKSKTLVLEWTRHALSLRDMDRSEFMRKFAGELCRIIEGYPAISGGTTFDAAFDLHARHGRNVAQALENAISDNASAVLSLFETPTSLMAMIIIQTGSTKLPPIKPRPPTLPSGPEQNLSPQNTTRLEISFEVQDGEHRISVRSLGVIHGAPARVGHHLRPQFEEDLAMGLHGEAYTFTPAGKLAKCDGSTKEAIVQNVKRCRDELSDFYRGIYGEDPPDVLLIQSRKPKGYRLDPDCRIIAGEQSDS